MKRLIIGLTGHSGAGKSTAADYLAEKYQLKVFEGSAILRQDAAKQGRQLVVREDYEGFFREQQQRRGLDYLSRLLLASDAPRALQSGLRSPADCERLQAVRGVVIGLVCDSAVALARTDKTNPKNAATIEQYAEQQKLQESTDEFGSHVSWIVEHADYQIDTSGPVEQTQAELDRVVAETLRKLDQ